MPSSRGSEEPCFSRIAKASHSAWMSWCSIEPSGGLARLSRSLMKRGVARDEHSLSAVSSAQPDAAESNRLGSDTRGRAGTARLPNHLMAEHYAQRSSAGLLVTEGTTI